MKKLLLATALLTGVASAEFYNYTYTDPMTDREFIVSSLDSNKADNLGEPYNAWLKLICTGNTFFMAVTHDNPIKTKVEIDTLEARFLPDKNIKFDAAGQIGEMTFFNFSDYSLQNMSNTEMRLRHENSGRQRWYYSFTIPDIETATAYQACRPYQN